jgi:hypothetical protein
LFDPTFIFKPDETLVARDQHNTVACNCNRPDIIGGQTLINREELSNQLQVTASRIRFPHDFSIARA